MELLSVAQAVHPAKSPYLIDGIYMKCFRTFAMFIALSFSLPVFAETDNKMTFDFDAINTSAALQLIADFAGLNLVSADDITGTVTMRMKGVSWQDALEFVVKTKNLNYHIDSGVLYVSHDADYFQSAEEPVAPEYKNSIFKVRHILASEAIKGFPVLSESGKQETLTSNDASSIVVARMSPERLDELGLYLSAVDFPRAQVMIEARIVEVDRSFSQELGVNWSGTARAGNFTATGSTNFVDMGSQISNAGIGFVSSALILDLELAAMEKGGYGKVISRPRVFASDRQQARIVKGSEVPYQQAAGDGATSVSFKEAALSLDVTPSIDETGVLLDVKLAKDEPDFSNAINGVPPIKTASLTSRVRVRLGSTIALGGVYSNTEHVQEHRVPGLASIPYLGRIFRYSTKSSGTSELILFITPTLIPAIDVAQVQDLRSRQPQ